MFPSTPEAKTEKSDGSRTAPGAERGKARTVTGLGQGGGGWLGPGAVLVSGATRAGRSASVDFGAEARLIVFREAETGSRAALLRGANPAKRDCAASVGERGEAVAKSDTASFRDFNFGNTR